MKKEYCLSSAFSELSFRCYSIAALGLAMAVMAQAADSTVWLPLFDGQSLRQWKASESPGTFKVVDGVIVAHGPRAHLFYVGDGSEPADFKNFEFSAEVLARPGANSGIFFHTAFQDQGWPEQGFEVQIDNSQSEHGGYLELKKTGSLYGVRNIYKTMARDNEWFTLSISVRARHVQVRLNDTLLVDYVEPVMLGASRHRRLSHGTFALQGHDPDSEALFRNLRVKRLPDDLGDAVQPEPFDGVAQEILKLSDENFPLVDFHTHLKGGLTLAETLEHMYRTGINHGIAINGGIGFPITNNAGIEQFRQSMHGAPCFIALQAEGREWPTLFSRDAIAKFDYVFTDAMTIPDLRGKRTRLWIPAEVEIPDKQASMEHLVTIIADILDHEPIDIYVNPTYLPDVISAEYDTLWTPERMDRVIAAAVRNGVAIEINSRFKIPSAAFIRRAKLAGIKFTLGTNNAERELGRLEYSLQMVRECGLGWKDMWMPKPDGRKPVQVRALR
jgi:3-keto-disaccharide hydrolase